MFLPWLCTWCFEANCRRHPFQVAVPASMCEKLLGQKDPMNRAPVVKSNPESYRYHFFLKNTGRLVAEDLGRFSGAGLSLEYF